MHTVAIVGVGLIGGSFALALRSSGFSGRILGVSSPGTLRRALDRGVVDEGLPLSDAVPQADLVYLAQPIARIVELLPEIAKMVRPHTLVTDAGSTKATIVARAQEVFPNGVFLGGHPMAGKAERGVEVAESGLFRNATYILTPFEAVLPASTPVVEFRTWLEKIGARILLLTPEAHDRIVAFTSHLPQMISTALASLLLQETGGGDAWRVAGGGLRDATRLAGSAYELWRDICMTNTGNIDQALSVYIQKLEHLRENLRRRELEVEFRQGAEFVAASSTM